LHRWSVFVMSRASRDLLGGFCGRPLGVTSGSLWRIIF